MTKYKSAGKVSTVFPLKLTLPAGYVFRKSLCTQSLYVSNKMPNYKMTEELTLKLIKGKPIYYQLQYFLDSDTDTLNEEQKQMLLLDLRYRDQLPVR